jgi:hypothetical protein
VSRTIAQIGMKGNQRFDSVKPGIGTSQRRVGSEGRRVVVGPGSTDAKSDRKG